MNSAGVPSPGWSPAPAAGPRRSNTPAAFALAAGVGALVALAFGLFGRVLVIPGLLSLVAIITGIVGLALVKRAGAGRWPALGGLLLGLATASALAVSVVSAVFEATAVDTTELEQQIVANSADYYGVDVVSVDCPSSVSPLATSEFTCTAFDSSGVAYIVDAEIDRDGFLWWELRL